MKTKILNAFVLTTILFISSAIISCGSENDAPIKGAAAQVAGTYAGESGINVMGIDCGSTGTLEIIMKEESESTVTVTLPECSFTIPNTDRRHTIEAFPVKGIKITENNNVYSIPSQDYTSELNGVTYVGSIQGTIAGKDAKINYSIKPGSMPMDINFSFEGIRK